MNDLIAAILALAFCGSAAAFLVMWANRDEWKKKANKEYTQRLEAAAFWSSHMFALKRQADFWRSLAAEAINERDALQDRVSTLVCPHNDHIWLEGRCKKCGRIK